MKTHYDVHSLSVLGGYLLFISLIVVIISIFSCKRNAEEIQQNHESTKVAGQINKDFLSQQKNIFSKAVGHSVQHYWDTFDLVKINPDNLSQQLEQAVEEFIIAIPYADEESVRIAITKSLNKMEWQKEALAYLLELYEMYFYNPNSPFRNDEYYIPILQYIIGSDSSSEGDKLRADFRLKMAAKNRVNTKATNVTYTLASGKTGTLYDISSRYIILMFYNPDCHSCEETIAYIEESPILSKAIERKDVALLAFYPDCDLSIWKRNLNKIPQNWINGYDKKGVVKSSLLYDLKAIPTLYLLDSNKTILLKDASLEAIEVYLQNEILNK